MEFRITFDKNYLNGKNLAEKGGENAIGKEIFCDNAISVYSKHCIIEKGKSKYTIILLSCTTDQL